jgi:hypothetical protein
MKYGESTTETQGFVEHSSGETEDFCILKCDSLLLIMDTGDSAKFYASTKLHRHDSQKLVSHTVGLLQPHARKAAYVRRRKGIAVS